VVLVPRNIIAVVTFCSDQGCHLKFGVVVKLFNYISVEALQFTSELLENYYRRIESKCINRFKPLLFIR